MANSADPDQLASSESLPFFRSQLIWIYTVCKGRAYLGSADKGFLIGSRITDIWVYYLHYIIILKCFFQDFNWLNTPKSSTLYTLLVICSTVELKLNTPVNNMLKFCLRITFTLPAKKDKVLPLGMSSSTTEAPSSPYISRDHFTHQQYILIIMIKQNTTTFSSLFELKFLYVCVEV